MTKEELARRTLNLEWAGRAPVYDLLVHDAAISYYAGERLTFANAHTVVYRAIARACDCTRLGILLPQRHRLEKHEDGSVYEHYRWTSWLRQGPTRTYEEYQQALRASAEALLSDWSAADQEALEASLAAYRRAKARLGDVLLMGNFGTKAGFMALFSPNSLEYLGYLLADDPELVVRVLEANTHKAVQRIEHLPDGWASHCPVVFVGEDMAYKTAPMVPPEFLRRQYWPRFERIVHAYHARGIKVVFHSDGNLWPLLDDLVATGVDGLNPLEAAAGMSPAAVRAHYPRLLLFGGIGYSALLVHATPAEVAQATRAAIHQASPGYFVGSDTELGNDIPLANVRAMIETAWEG